MLARALTSPDRKIRQKAWCAVTCASMAPMAALAAIWPPEQIARITESLNADAAGAITFVTVMLTAVAIGAYEGAKDPYDN